MTVATSDDQLAQGNLLILDSIVGPAVEVFSGRKLCSYEYIYRLGVPVCKYSLTLFCLVLSQAKVPVFY